MAQMRSFFLWLMFTVLPSSAHAVACSAEGAVIPVPMHTLEDSLDAPLPAHTVFAWKEREEWRFALLPLRVLDKTPTRERITQFTLSGLPALRAEMKHLTIGTPVTFRILDSEQRLPVSHAHFYSALFDAATDAGVDLQIPQ